MERIAERQPLTGRLAKFLQRRGVRGGYKLERYARALGWLRCVYRQRLERGAELYVPLNLRSYDITMIEDYEREVVQWIVERVASVALPCHVVDCGADIGLIGSMVATRATLVSQVTFVEPNEEVHECLQRTAQSLPCKAQVMLTAVGDRQGSGTLRARSYDASAHAMYVALDGVGSTRMTTIDSLIATDEHAHVVIKLDVEGGELAALEGARRSLARTPHVTIIFESHPRVIARTGIETADIIAYLLGERPDCVWSIVEDRANRKPPSYSDIPRESICNIRVYTPT